MNRLTDKQLDEAIAYRPYKRPNWNKRASRGSFILNFALCSLTFFGGSIVYAEYRQNLPKQEKVLPSLIRAYPQDSLPPLSEEEFINFDGRTQ